MSDAGLVLAARIDELADPARPRPDELQGSIDLMLRLMRALDKLLRAHPSFVFDAGASEQQRALVTLWHPDNDGALSSYASQLLGGDLMALYVRRWTAYLRALAGTGPKLRHGAFRAMELDWIRNSTTPRPAVPQQSGPLVKLVHECLLLCKQAVQREPAYT
jgi:hypothetical protein